LERTRSQCWSSSYDYLLGVFGHAQVDVFQARLADSEVTELDAALERPAGDAIHDRDTVASDHEQLVAVLRDLAA
jgi:hypothetical protein